MRAITAFVLGLLLMLFAWWFSKIPVPQLDGDFIHQYYLNMLEFGGPAFQAMLTDFQQSAGSVRNYFYDLFGWFPP